MGIHRDDNIEITGEIAKWGLGFVGAMAAVLIVPRLLRAVFRNYAFRVIAEIVGVLTLGLVTEKIFDWVSSGDRAVAPPPRTERMEETVA